MFHYTLEKENANKMGSPYLNWFDEYYAGLGISTPELFPNDSSSDFDKPEIGPAVKY